MTTTDLILTLCSICDANSVGKEEHFIKIIPTNREMPTPDKYLNTKKPKNPKKKKRGY